MAHSWCCYEFPCSGLLDTSHRHSQHFESQVCILWGNIIQQFSGLSKPKLVFCDFQLNGVTQTAISGASWSQVSHCCRIAWTWYAVGVIVNFFVVVFCTPHTCTPNTLKARFASYKEIWLKDLLGYQIQTCVLWLSVKWSDTDCNLES